MADKRGDPFSQTVGVMAVLLAGFATRKLVTVGWKNCPSVIFIPMKRLFNPP